ncbi:MULTISPECIES: hypothetical protein [unclassified Arthrobacter]|nr:MULTISPECIES: hypothetical protein [unclassified Arthrobacter]MDF2048444.1 hypothetical protein [Arthrobacter sp. Cr_A7]
MANVIERRHGRRRGPGPAKGNGQPLAVLGVVVLMIAALVTAYALMR